MFLKKGKNKIKGRPDGGGKWLTSERRRRGANWRAWPPPLQLIYTTTSKGRDSLSLDERPTNQRKNPTGWIQNRPFSLRRSIHNEEYTNRIALQECTGSLFWPIAHKFVYTLEKRKNFSCSLTKKWEPFFSGLWCARINSHFSHPTLMPISSLLLSWYDTGLVRLWRNGDVRARDNRPIYDPPKRSRYVTTTYTHKRFPPPSK